MSSGTTAADAYLRALERRRCVGLDLGALGVHLRLGFRRRPLAAARAARRPWAGDGTEDPCLPFAAALEQALAGACQADARTQRGLWASTSTKNPDLPDTYHLGRLAAPNTIDTVPEKTLLAFADHGSLNERLEPDCAAAERAIAAAADAGIDADALAEHLQRYGAGAFTAD
jgi:transaldolase